jgi:hypothetical protein
VLHVLRVAGVPAHPVGERDVVRQQRGIVTARGQPGGLHVWPGVEQARGDPVELGGRRRGEHLAHRHRVAG